MFILTDAITVNTVEENRLALLAFLQEQAEKSSKEAVLDASSLRDLDTAGVQLLLSAFKSASQKGLRLYLVNTDDFVLNMLELCGAGDVLCGS